MDKIMFDEMSLSLLFVAALILCSIMFVMNKNKNRSITNFVSRDYLYTRYYMRIFASLFPRVELFQDYSGRNFKVIIKDNDIAFYLPPFNYRIAGSVNGIPYRYHINKIPYQKVHLNLNMLNVLWPTTVCPCKELDCLTCEFIRFKSLHFFDQHFL